LVYSRTERIAGTFKLLKLRTWSLWGLRNAPVVIKHRRFMRVIEMNRIAFIGLQTMLAIKIALSAVRLHRRGSNDYSVPDKRISP
jgi:hypothetical protein